MPLPRALFILCLSSTVAFAADNEPNTTESLIINGCKLAPEAQCPNVDLRHANLKQLDLHGINLSGANLTRADLRHANLRGANLTGAILDTADLRLAFAQGVNAQNANLHGANLEFARISGGNFNGADFTAANLEMARADRTQFVGATFITLARDTPSFRSGRDSASAIADPVLAPLFVKLSSVRNCTAVTRGTNYNTVNHDNKTRLPIPILP